MPWMHVANHVCVPWDGGVGARMRAFGSIPGSKARCGAVLCYALLFLNRPCYAFPSLDTSSLAEAKLNVWQTKTGGGKVKSWHLTLVSSFLWKLNRKHKGDRRSMPARLLFRGQIKPSLWRRAVMAKRQGKKKRAIVAESVRLHAYMHTEDPDRCPHYPVRENACVKKTASLHVLRRVRRANSSP
ncbi:hypothetical protein BS50DRAFT_70729 [Corynespora cassiicola Philippines]|uniref:Uncharacterized protein n=1 Tax=Corynespora cassiicola Philippines TaxID=1448308 RepID=A0A2T2NG44_CORCC|nr:hypothetical protein BS50DRAFT_70729 [Corynespora cassiicola Philippines]